MLLKGVSGKLLANDKIALTGRSGSGKSLLLSALADLLALDSGQISYNDTPIEQIMPAKYRAQVALLTQSPAMIDGTVLDNLALPFTFRHHKARTLNMDWHKDKLAGFGKSPEFLHTSADTLSGGEKQIVNFLRTLQLNPSVLLLDEPTAALDPQTREVLTQMVLDWHTQNADKGAAFIWITHTPEQIGRLNEQEWVMADGQMTKGDGA
ncbi:hypothetical protein B0181_05280 [Moraxella caviae]|uniref:ABC transporter domain-containing protein n=1 Tax=Moraxella caviae TaxID=34060 RepID=A0A1T0A3E8_9GAMM|nr:hypothetical protein B0181_05280 [Moraxella caviae]